MKLNCVVTDDEPIAREIIVAYIQKIPELELVAVCSDAIETISALRSNRVDVLFIDIQMPEISGLDLVRSLSKLPLVIFTTAHPAFAVDSFELDVVDYLLKPISKERFLKAMNKIYSRHSANQVLQAPFRDKPENESKFFFAKSDLGLVRVDYDSILYIEGLENYIKIICENKTVVTMSTMKALESSLPAANFMRIHRSYIVNMDKVESVRDFCFQIKAHRLQVGKSYKKSVINLIKEKYSQKGIKTEKDPEA